MRSPVRLLALLAAALVAPTACNSDGLQAGAAVDMAAVPDLSAEPESAKACEQLATCDCLTHRGCRPVTTPCWCPGPTCGPIDCVCAGGGYLGCALLSDACPEVACGVADSITPADAKGCHQCVPPASCERGVADLEANCSLGKEWLGGLGCDKNPDCIVACMRPIRSCFDVGCAFCTTCDCSGATDFDKCVFKCLK